MAEVAAFLCSDRASFVTARSSPSTVAARRSRVTARRPLRRRRGRHRVDDARLLTGHGTYVDDVALPGMLHASLRAQHVRTGRSGHRHVRRARAARACTLFTAADLNPDVKEQWHTSIGPAGPGDAAPAARRRRGPLRRRPGRARRRRDAARSRTTPPSWSTSTTSRCRPSSTTPTAEDADVLVHEAHGSNVIGELDGLPVSTLDDVFDDAGARRHANDPPAGVHRRPMEGRGLVVDYSRRRASSRSTPRRRRRTRCACSAPACSASPSTGSA